jgi:hypothetical protein
MCAPASSNVYDVEWVARVLHRATAEKIFGPLYMASDARLTLFRIFDRYCPCDRAHTAAFADSAQRASRQTEESSKPLCRKACRTVDFWDGVLHSERFALLYFDSFRGDATIQLPGLGAQ